MAQPGLVCGIDVGGSKILGAVVDPADPSRPAVKLRLPTPPAEELVGTLASLVRTLQADAGASGGLAGVGVGIAGLVDSRGRLLLSPNLPGVRDLPLGELLNAATGLPVAVENDATAAAWAEHLLGAGRGERELVVVTLGTGIGVGIIAGGQLLRGRNGFAGEAGHMVVDPSGPPCPCGGRGCWERYASGSGLAHLAREAARAGRLGRVLERVDGDLDGLCGEHLTAAVRSGDPEAVVVLEEFAGWVALGLANLANVLDPGMFVLGGGLTSAADLFMEPVREAQSGRLYASGSRPVPEVVVAALGDEAGATGAALLAAERMR